MNKFSRRLETGVKPVPIAKLAESSKRARQQGLALLDASRVRRIERPRPEPTQVPRSYFGSVKAAHFYLPPGSVTLLRRRLAADLDLDQNAIGMITKSAYRHACSWPQATSFDLDQRIAGHA
jgi:hypothetical protein